MWALTGAGSSEVYRYFAVCKIYILQLVIEQLIHLKDDIQMLMP